MSDYTPGPWVISGWAILDEANRTVICNILPWDVSGCRKEDVDNARLIAAAPDLLEALEALDNYYKTPGEDSWPKFYRQVLVPARAAIAKAKGEFS